MLRDIDLRSALKDVLEAEDHGSSALLTEELKLASGLCRADVVLLNGTMHGFELKSHADSLKRFRRQCAHYSGVFDYCTLVVCSIHMGKARKIMPKWWGMLLAKRIDHQVELRRVRKPKLNPRVKIDSLLKIPSKTELISLCREAEIKGAYVGKTRPELRQLLKKSINPERLSFAICEMIKDRHSRSRAGN